MLFLRGLAPRLVQIGFLADPPRSFPWGCVMQHKKGTLEGFTAASGFKRLLYFEGHEDIGTAIAQEKQRKGWRCEKKLKLIGTINPEFKDLAQTWGWKMITVHEKVYPCHQVRTEGRSCSPASVSKRLEQYEDDKHPRGPSTPRHQALCLR
jgi:putative endonuclease